MWFHGDVAPANLLLDEAGRLCAVIDFGQFGVGDPACDVTIAWTLLRDPARETFRAAVAVDEATWVRGRGWALWKALSTVMAGDAGPYFIAQAHDVLRELRVVHDAGRGPAVVAERGVGSDGKLLSCDVVWGDRGRGDPAVGGAVAGGGY